MTGTLDLDFAMYEPEPEGRDLALRDLFVDEYLKDYSPIAAGLRCGLMRDFAEDWAKQFLNESYVRKRIKRLEQERTNDPEYLKTATVAWLVREANYFGPGCSHSSRVAALGNLSNVLGMKNGPQNDENLEEDELCVMVVPQVQDLSNWEDVASNSQQKLKQSVKTVVPA